MKRRRPKKMQEAWENCLEKGISTQDLQVFVKDPFLGGLWFKDEAGELLLQRSSSVEEVLFVIENVRSLRLKAWDKLWEFEPTTYALVRVIK